jgi:LysR family transcriptional regulator, regulator for bpeEF and oprC
MTTQTLRIQVPGSLGRLLIAHSIPRFIDMHPGLRIEMHEENSNGEMLPRDVDAVICIGPIADSSLSSRQIGTLSRVTCASSEFIARNGRPTAAMHLLPTHCIALLDPGTHRAQEWAFRRGSATYSISPAGPLAFSDAGSAVAAAVRGGGYVRVLSIEADQHIASGLLQPVLEEWNEEKLSVKIAYSQDRVASDEIVAFGDFVAGLLPPVAHARASGFVPTEQIAEQMARAWQWQTTFASAAKASAWSAVSMCRSALHARTS